MKKKKLHPFIIAAGLKSPEEFYAKYSNEEAFFNDYPHMRNGGLPDYQGGSVISDAWNKEDLLQLNPEIVLPKKEVPKKSSAYEGSFGQAFKAARKDLGAGKVFEWNGKMYTTNYKEEIPNKIGPSTKKTTKSGSSTKPTSTNSAPKRSKTPDKKAIQKAVKTGEGWFYTDATPEDFDGLDQNPQVNTPVIKPTASLNQSGNNQYEVNVYSSGEDPLYDSVYTFPNQKNSLGTPYTIMPIGLKGISHEYDKEFLNSDFLRRVGIDTPRYKLNFERKNGGLANLILQKGGLAPVDYKSWNNFQDYLQSQNLVGLPSMDRGQNRSQTYLDAYRKIDPSFSINQDGVSDYQEAYRSMGLPVSNNYSKEDDYIGSVTSTYRFPEEKIAQVAENQFNPPAGVSLTPIYDRNGWSLFGMQGNDGKFYKPENMPESMWNKLASKRTTEYIQPLLDQNFGKDFYTYTPAMKKGGYRQDYANGGVQQAFQMQSPNVEVEGKENIQLPNGISFEVKGNSHAQGGVEMNLPEESFVFSEKIKMPTNLLKQFYGVNKLNKSQKKSSFADIANKFKTEKDFEQLNSGDQFQRMTAAINIQNKNQRLDQLALLQEKYKFGLGMENNLERVAQTKFEKGGLVKMQDAGYPPPNYNPVEAYPNTYQLGQVNDFYANNLWGPQVFEQASNLSSQYADVPSDITGFQSYYANNWPNAVQYGFNNWWPNTIKGVKSGTDKPGSELTQQEALRAWSDGKAGNRAPVIRNKQFNSKAEFEEWAKTQDAIAGDQDTLYGNSKEENMFYNPVFPLSVPYAPRQAPIDFYRLGQQGYNPNDVYQQNIPQRESTQRRDPVQMTSLSPIQPRQMGNQFPEQQAPENPIQQGNEEQREEPPVWNELDLSKIRNANALGLVASGISSMNTVNYPVMMPNLPAPNYMRGFDTPKLQQSIYNNQIGQQLSQINNSGLDSISKQALANDAFARTSRQDNAVNTESMLNTLNQNYNIMNQGTRNNYQTGIRNLQQYLKDVDQVNAGKTKARNEALKNLTSYYQQKAHSDTYLPLAMQQSGVIVERLPNGNYRYRPDPAKNRLTEQELQLAMMKLQAQRNQQATSKGGE